MELFMQNLFSIGEIASIFDETTETFRHYDRVQLLKPYVVKENGYRYYSLDQFEIISTILHLRSIGTSIEKIKTLLHSKSKEKISDELKFQKLELQNQIEHLKKLEQQANILIERFETFIPNKISLSKEPDFYILAQNFPTTQLAIDTHELQSFRDKIDSEWLKNSNIISIIDVDSFHKGEFHQYTRYGLISELPCNIANAYYSWHPSRLYLTASIKITSFDHSEIDSIYLELLDYIMQHNLNVTGDIFERDILDLYNDDAQGDIHYIKIYVPVSLE